MNTLTAMMKKTLLFSGLTADAIQQELLPHGQLQEAPKGTYLIVPQQYVDHFAVVLEGRIHTLHLFPDGNYSLMGALLPGNILGADLICTKTRLSPYHALVAEPVKLYSFPAKILTHPGTIPEPDRLQILGSLLTLISQTNMKKEYRLAILSQKGLRERIVTYLTMQAERQQSNTFQIPFSREDLASFLCVNRSALSHELSLMRREGLLSFRKNSFTIYFPYAPNV